MLDTDTGRAQGLAGKQRGILGTEAVFQTGAVGERYFFVPTLFADDILAFEGENPLQIERHVGQADVHVAGQGILGVGEARVELVGFAREGFGKGQVGVQRILEHALVVVAVAALVLVCLDVDRAAKTTGGVCP